MHLLIIWLAVIIGLCVAFKFRYNILFSILWLCAILADSALSKGKKGSEWITLDDYEEKIS